MKISLPAPFSASSASIESEDTKFQLYSDEGMGEEQILEGSRAPRKDTGLSNCVVQLVQANERLMMQILELQESLSVSHIERNLFQEESSKLRKESFSLNKEKQADTMQISELQESLALARKERNEFQEDNAKLLKADAILKDAKTAEVTVQLSELQESLALDRKERIEFQVENSKVLQANLILKDAETAEATVKILDHQTSLTSKLLREVACPKNTIKAEVRTLFERLVSTIPALDRKALDRKQSQERNSRRRKELRANLILEKAKTAEVNDKILKHQTPLTLFLQEEDSKVLREVACLKNAMEAEERKLFMRMSMRSSRW